RLRKNAPTASGKARMTRPATRAATARPTETKKSGTVQLAQSGSLHAEPQLIPASVVISAATVTASKARTAGLARRRRALVSPLVIPGASRRRHENDTIQSLNGAIASSGGGAVYGASSAS